MSSSLSEFDDFLKKFHDASGDPSLDYWSDAIFVTRWLGCPLVEKRFKGGMALWFIWAMQKVLQAGGKSNPPLTPTQGWSVTDGYRLLATPAHQESLSPLLAQAKSGSVRIFGDAPDTQLPQPHAATGFPSSIAALGRRDRFRALVRAFRAHRRIAQILAQCEFPASPPTKDFHARLIEQMFTTELELIKLRTTEPPLRSLFITYELAADSKALVLWARETRARVIHVMHGQRLPTYQVTQATDLVLFSKLDEPWFRARVGSGTRIWAIGHPRLEKLRRDVPPPQPRNGRLHPRIAFFSQPSEGDYTPELRDADWRILLALRDTAEVRFRLHPREDQESAVRALQRCGLDFVILSDAGLQEDLEWCDAVASSWSTVSMEAAACGRGIFWTCSTPEKYEASQELRDAGIGALVSDTAGWDMHLEEWASAGWGTPVLLPEARLRELGMIGDMDRPWLERLGIE